jgi:hypothetical protein
MAAADKATWPDAPATPTATQNTASSAATVCTVTDAVNAGGFKTQ